MCESQQLSYRKMCQRVRRIVLFQPVPHRSVLLVVTRTTTVSIDGMQRFRYTERRHVGGILHMMQKSESSCAKVTCRPCNSTVGPCNNARRTVCKHIMCRLPTYTTLHCSNTAYLQHGGGLLSIPEINLVTVTGLMVSHFAELGLRPASIQR